MYSFTFCLLHTGFLCLVLGCHPSCGARARGPPRRGSLAAARGPQACRLQYLWSMGLVASQHVGSSRTRNQTLVPCIGRWILTPLPPEDDILNEDLKEQVRKEARWLSERLRQGTECTRASFMWL